MDNIFIELEKRDILSRMCDKVSLIGIREYGETIQTAEAHLDELEGLVRSLGIPTAGSLLVTLKSIHTRWLLGKGKVEEVAQAIADQDADLVVFDSDLSPAQQRNLEENWHTAVIDRREVILDIFADRASTREAVLQVALARMKYSLPRLTRAWTHLSRQRGGAKGNRGKGETQLETDRRLVLSKIANFKRDLAKVREQRDVRRKKRLERPVPSVSLVGYTNAGKSSLLNAVSGSRVLVEDKLFATLDPTTRRVEQTGGREFLITDTVGFIRKLPHDLVDAFRSTLEEAVLADVIIHVADAHSHELDEHVKVTEKVLRELGSGDKTRLLVLNKCDSLTKDEREALSFLHPQGLLVSAHTGEGIQTLLEKLGACLDASRPIVTLHLPPDRWDVRARLHKEATVLDEQYDDEGLTLTVRLSAEERGRLLEFVVEV
ncbi:MAG: GTPase HflX [Spirochaetes bacterium]|nr:MAG: GTPase HflX [Spirochaetota bacterium]